MTEILPADINNTIRAAELLRAGALVAFGTETVYGLGGDATNPEAVAAIFAAKGRPRFNPLICHYPAAGAAFEDVVANDLARQLAASFWPGPLSIILPRRASSRIAELTGAGLPTLAVRVPDHRDALMLLAATARPVAAPSANRTGQVSPTSAAHVLHELNGAIAAVLDSGPCAVGVESTVVDASSGVPVLLRPGGVTVEAIEAVCGPVGRPTAKAGPRNTIISPGQLASHYAPSLPVRCDAISADAHELLLAFGPPPSGESPVYQLSETANLTEAASRLFEGLRWLDQEGARLGLRRIAAMPVPLAGLGLAIDDRLRRASAPRPP